MLKGGSFLCSILPIPGMYEKWNSSSQNYQSIHVFLSLVKSFIIYTVSFLFHIAARELTTAVDTAEKIHLLTKLLTNFEESWSLWKEFQIVWDWRGKDKLVRRREQTSSFTGYNVLRCCEEGDCQWILIWYCCSSNFLSLR